MAKKCSRCPNGLLVIEETLLTAFLEPGAQPGDVLTFEGAGQQSVGLDAGDLLIHIVQENEDDKSATHTRDD